MVVFEIIPGIKKLVPGAKFRGSFDEQTEAEYNALEWLDPRPKPDYIDVEEAALQVMRNRIKEQINQKTDYLIEHALTFDDGSGDDIPIHLGIEEQINLDTMDRLRVELDAMGMIVFPYSLKVSDNEDGEGNYITLQNADHLHAFFLTGVGHKNTMIATGRALKDSLGTMNRTALEEFRDER